MLNKVAFPLACTIAATLVFSSCKKDDPEPSTPTVTEDPELVVPATYNFENVDYSGQTERLDQLTEMVTYLKTANTAGVELDLEKLRSMYDNTTSTKQLKNKTFESHQQRFDTYFQQIVEASKSTEAAANGTAGAMASSDGSSSRLFDANGVELAQIIEKELMGAVFYYQAVGVYLSDDKMNVDNTEVTAGKGTAMQHHWDEAFGYLGVAKDYPGNEEGARFWGKYSLGRNDLLNTADELSEAFRKGRAAINVEDYETRDEAIAEIQTAWENVCAGTAIHYLNEALANMGDDNTRNHVLSEGKAFVNSLFYNPERRITPSDIDKIIDLIGANFYEADSKDITAARDMLVEIYGWESIKSSL